MAGNGSDIRIEILDGPHRGPSTYPRPAPRALMCMDPDFCYHEYTRVDPINGIHRYRYVGRIGRPSWANCMLVFPQVTH
jgi:hypothetical protein